MLQLGVASADKCRYISILAHASWIPEAYRRLHTQLVFESTDWDTAWEPHLRAGASESPILKEHAHDGEHGQSSVGNFCIELPLPAILIFHRSTCIRDTQDAAILKVARSAGGVSAIQAEVNKSAEDEHLDPAQSRHSLEGIEAVGDVCEFDAQGGRAVARELD